MSAFVRFFHRTFSTCPCGDNGCDAIGENDRTFWGVSFSFSTSYGSPPPKKPAICAVKSSAACRGAMRLHSVHIYLEPFNDLQGECGRKWKHARSVRFGRAKRVAGSSSRQIVVASKGYSELAPRQIGGRQRIRPGSTITNRPTRFAITRASFKHCSTNDKSTRTIALSGGRTITRPK